MFKWIADYLIRRAMRTPYNDLRNPDRSFYMGRYWLVPIRRKCAVTWRRPIARVLQYFDIAIRVHHIGGPDRDRALHDHPWAFISIVLRGSYSEWRPDTIDPCFYGEGNCVTEVTHTVFRNTGSIAFRRATDRHRIPFVFDNTWTLFITFPKRQWWGFYTPAGKVYWKDYESAHNTRGVKSDA